MSHVIVYPTFRCGLGCSYCWWKVQPDGLSMLYAGGSLYKVENELPWRTMFTLLRSFGDRTVFEFTGGETLKYEGIQSLLNNLPIWAITSNTVNSLDGINLRKCFSWTASYHPHISDKAKDKFMENLERIKFYGVHTAITMVATPQNVDEVITKTKEFKQLGYSVNIHPYYDDPNFDWEKYPEAKKKLLENEFLRYGERFFHYGSIHGCDNCHGGLDYFVVAPDGRTYRCVTEMTYGGQAITHPDVEVYKCKRECLVPCDWHFGIREGYDKIYAVNAGKE